MNKVSLLFATILFSFSAMANETTFEGIPLSGSAATAKEYGFKDCTVSGLSDSIVCIKPLETIIAGEKIQGLQILLEKNGTYQGLHIKRKPENNLNFARNLENDGWVESGQYSHTHEYFKKDTAIKIQISGYPSDADISQIEIMPAEPEKLTAALKRNADFKASEAKTNATLEFMNK